MRNPFPLSFVVRAVSLGAVGFATLILAGGCSAVPVAQQRLVSQAAMTFESSASGHGAVNLTAQIEPGTAASGGAQNAGCTSCR